MTRSAKSGTSRTRPGIPCPGGAVTAGLIAGTLALLVTACGAGSGPAASRTAVPTGAEPVPQDVHTLPDSKLPPGTLGTSCVPHGSLRPVGPLPPPRHMPAGSAMAVIAKRGYLRVGVDQTIDLSSYRNPLTGQLEGFDISVAEKIAQAIFGKPDDGNPNEHIQFKAITSAQRIPVIQNGQVDIVADSMTITCNRQHQIAAISTDDSVLAGLAAQDPQTRLLGPTFTHEQHGIAMSQNAPDLVRFVNAVLERMRTDGTWAKLYKQWFVPGLGPTVPAPPRPQYSG